MPLPTSYSELQLAEFMQRQLKDVAYELDWTNTAPNGDYQDAINSTLRVYGGITDTTQATDVVKLEMLARWAIWREAVDGLITRVDYTLSQQNVRASQMFAQANLRLQSAESALTLCGIDLCPGHPGENGNGNGGLTIGVGKAVFRDDPYRMPIPYEYTH